MHANTHPLYSARTILTMDDALIAHALAQDAIARKIMARNTLPAPGTLVGARLNLNILKSQQVAVQTVHAGSSSGGHRRNKGFYHGTALGYLKIVTLDDAYFNVHQPAREKIASGLEAKSPMASIDGLFSDRPPCFDGIEIRFNPKEVHLFVDADLRPIRHAQHVTIYGHRAYAQGEISYYDCDTAPARSGEAPSAVRF